MPNFTHPEVSEVFARTYGAVIGQLVFENLQLQKEVQALQEHIAQITATNGTLPNALDPNVATQNQNPLAQEK